MAESVAGGAIAVPLGGHSRPRRFVKIAVWTVALGVLLAILQLLGVDVRSWFSELWTQIKEMPAGNISAHPVATIVIVVGGAFLITILVRAFWKQVKKLWAQAKQGGVILSTPGRYFRRVFLPSFVSYLCKYAVIGIFLAAFTIPVT